MNVRQIPFSEVPATTMEPHAILARPVAFFVEHLGRSFDEGTDDLDDYEATGLVFNYDAFGALVRHRGNPPDEVTLMLRFGDEHRLAEVVTSLGVPPDAVIWQSVATTLPR